MTPLYTSRSSLNSRNLRFRRHLGSTSGVSTLLDPPLLTRLSPVRSTLPPSVSRPVWDEFFPEPAPLVGPEVLPVDVSVQGCRRRPFDLGMDPWVYPVDDGRSKRLLNEHCVGGPSDGRD